MPNIIVKDSDPEKAKVEVKLPPYNPNYKPVTDGPSQDFRWKQRVNSKLAASRERTKQRLRYITTPRVGYSRTYSENWERIFGKKD